jgi:Tfp pilus assembly protein PilF
MAIGYRNLAFLQWQSGDARGANKTLERAFRADAIEPGMTTQLGSYLAEAGRPADAIALLEPLTAETPADPDALNALGIAYARGGQAERSAAVFRRALDENPSNVQALENIGTLEMQRGNLIDAKTHSKRRDRSAFGPRAQRPRVVAMHAAPRARRSSTEARRALAPNDFSTRCST